MISEKDKRMVERTIKWSIPTVIICLIALVAAILMFGSSWCYLGKLKRVYASEKIEELKPKVVGMEDLPGEYKEFDKFRSEEEHYLISLFIGIGHVLCVLMFIYIVLLLVMIQTFLRSRKLAKILMTQLHE